MSEQIRAVPRHKDREDLAKEQVEQAAVDQAQERAKNVGKTAVDNELDELLDEIDNLITEETVAMAVGYTQVGGE